MKVRLYSEQGETAFEMDAESVCLTTPEEEHDLQSPHIGDMTIELTIQYQPKTLLVLYGVTNNCIRLHGGRPLRNIKKKFL